MKELAIFSIIIFLCAFFSAKTSITVTIIEILFGVILTSTVNFTQPQWLDTFSLIGSLIILFIAGSEIDLKYLKQNKKPILTIGLCSYFISFFSLLLVSKYIFGLSIYASIIISSACSVTSIAMIYPVLKDYNVLGKEIGKLILGIAFIPAFLVTLTMYLCFSSLNYVSVLYTFIVITIILVINNNIELIDKKLNFSNSSEMKIRFILMTIFVLSFLASLCNINASIIMFILGAMFANMLDKNTIIKEKLHAIGFGIFIPAFFIRAGMYFSYQAFLQNIYIIIILTIISFILKYLTTFYFGKRYLKQNTKTVSILMNARLAIGTIVAVYGLNSGFIDTKWFSIIISVIIITSLVSILGITKKLRLF